MSTTEMHAGTTFPAIVGAILATERKQAGFTQAEFAQRVGIVQSTWSRIEQGTSALNIEQLAIAATALNTKPHTILEQADRTAEEIQRRDMQVEYKPQKKGNGGLLLLGAAALTALVIAANKNK